MERKDVLLQMICLLGFIFTKAQKQYESNAKKLEKHQLKQNKLLYY